MKARDIVTKDILSYLISQIDAKAKDTQLDVSDEDIFQLIKKEIKMRRESMDMYIQAGKQSEWDDEASKIAVLEVYLPPMMSQDEMRSLVERLVAELDIQDVAKERWKLIGAIMQDYRPVVDGSMMNEVINSMIGS